MGDSRFYAEAWMQTSYDRSIHVNKYCGRAKLPGINAILQREHRQVFLNGKELTGFKFEGEYIVFNKKLMPEFIRQRPNIFQRMLGIRPKPIKNPKIYWLQIIGFKI